MHNEIDYYIDEVLKGILGYSDEKIKRLKEQEKPVEELKAHTRRRL